MPRAPGTRPSNSRRPNPDGSIAWVRLPTLQGVEVFDVRGVSRKWAYFHETYSFCVSSRVVGDRDVPWRYRGRTHVMRCDRVQLMEPGELHANLTAAPVADFRVVLLTPEMVARVAQSLGRDTACPLHLKVADLADGPVRRVLQRLAAAVVETRDAEAAETLVVQLLRTLSDSGCLETRIARGVPRTDRRTALRARDLIHDLWNQHLSLERLSAEVNAPISTLERTFRETFGVAPRQYQNHLRVLKGKVLLARPGVSIEAVAASAGFRDRGYFTRLFRRELGVSPKMYRTAALARERGARLAIREQYETGAGGALCEKTSIAAAATTVEIEGRSRNRDP